MKNYDFRITTDTKTVTGSCAIGFSDAGVPFARLISIDFKEPIESPSTESLRAISKVLSHFIGKLNEDFDSLSYARTFYIDLRTPEPTIGPISAQGEPYNG